LGIFQFPAFPLTDLPQKAPKLPKRGIWLNASEDPNFKKFKGHVTVLSFWDYASINSIRSLYYLKKWEELYKPLGLQIIGIHAPDYTFEYKRENLEKALERMEIPYPVLMDNNFRLWNKYGVFLWPTNFIINHEGQVIYEQVGEGGNRKFEEMIRLAISQADPNARFSALATPRDIQYLFDETFCGVMSEEIRVGSGSKDNRLRVPNIANEEGFRKGKIVNYEDKGRRHPRGFFVHGPWKNQEDYFEYVGKKASLEDYVGIDFEAYELYTALSSHRIDPVRFYLLLDSQPIEPSGRGKDVSVDENGNTYVLVDEPRLYYLAKNP